MHSTRTNRSILAFGLTMLLAVTPTVANLELSEVDLVSGIIEITNTSEMAFNGNRLEWCIPFVYGTLEAAPFTFAPGETRTYDTMQGMLNASDDLWIYLNRTGGFGDESRVTSGVVWGSNQSGSGRVNNVVNETMGEAWADANDFVDTSALTAGDTLQLVFPGDQPNVSTGWEIAPSTLGIFGCAATGDFNGDGSFTTDEIDALTGTIANGAFVTDQDLDCSGTVDTTDLDLWLAEAGAAQNSSGNPYLPGDADLDGAVDAADFIAWNDNKFQNVTEWSRGNFEVDGAIDAADFIVWNDNKFTSSDAAVPEPATAGWAILIGVTMMRRRQR